MDRTFCLLLMTAGVLSGCGGDNGSDTVTKSPPRMIVERLNPKPGSENEIECRVFDIRNEKTTLVLGRQVTYMSGPLPSSDNSFPIQVSHFSYEGVHWIGLAGELYVYRNGTFTGMTINGSGFAWLTNFAGNRLNQSLEEDVASFQKNVSLKQLGHHFLREWQRDAVAGEPKGWTEFGEAIPLPYARYLLTVPPDGASIGRAKYVSTVVDGKLLCITVSDQTGVMFPRVWINLDTKMAIKADNYRYDPDEKSRERVRRSKTGDVESPPQSM